MPLITTCCRTVICTYHARVKLQLFERHSDRVRSIERAKSTISAMFSAERHVSCNSGGIKRETLFSLKQGSTVEISTAAATTDRSVSVRRAPPRLPIREKYSLSGNWTVSILRKYQPRYCSYGGDSRHLKPICCKRRR